VALPPDFYLQDLRQLRLDDLEAVAELTRTYGVLFDEDTELPPSVNTLATDPERLDGDLVLSMSRNTINIYLEVAHEAIDTWMALQTEGGLREQAAQELPDIKHRLAEQGVDPNDLTLEWWMQEKIDELSSTLNGALSRYSIGIGLPEERGSTVYSAAFLQMYNHMVEGATVKHCANEPCGKPFVRQRGRAQFDQHRTEGVKYCSRQCARAQAQRELRRRRRASHPS
jgi:hypothetical protein